MLIFFTLLASGLLGRSNDLSFPETGPQDRSMVRGKVQDGNGAGLPGANIYLAGTYDGTSSDSEGTFSLETGHVGIRTLKIEFVGFKSYTQDLDLNGQILDLGTIRLKEEINDLTAVTITAGTFEAGDNRKSIALSSLDMVTTAGASGDVFGALKSLPGTTPVGESGKLFVKGGDSRESATYIDGNLVYVPYSSSTPNQSVRGRFNPFMFSGMMFSTGGYSAEYGQALSSVLALQTNAMPVQDQLNLSLLTVGAELGGSKTWESVSVSSTLSYYNLSPYMKLVPQFTRWETEPRSFSGDLSLRWRTGKSGMLKVYATANRSRLSALERSLDRSDTYLNYKLLNDNIFINTSWAGELKENWILSTGFSYTHNADHIQFDTAKHMEELVGTHAKVTLKHRINDHIRILAGGEHFYKQYGFRFPSMEMPDLPGFSNHLAGIFIESELYASTRFVTRVGIRGEYSFHLNRTSLAPRLSTAYKLSGQSQVSMAYGWFFQDPADEFLLYTNRLKSERADHLTFNYMFKEDQRVLRTELFYKDYKNLVRYSGQQNGPYEGLNNGGEGHAYGLDLFWRDRRSIPSAEYWISYSYIDARRLYLHYPHESIPGFSSKHNLSLVYKHWIDRLRSQLGATFHISSPRYYHNPNSSEFNGEKTQPYQSLDLNWSFLPAQNVILYASVSNVLGLDQSFGRRYSNMPDENGFYQSAPILPAARRFFLLGCFITLSRNGELNQLDKIN